MPGFNGKVSVFIPVQWLPIQRRGHSKYDLAKNSIKMFLF
ncbi:hypothetical protein D1AOALGA4SA_7427 [Olavius algarvensis Delta 1 endosymbiont]|nr:hypothetical protein D1AOALGA4SA_7427 [Olavius algarvensis Delta 1 endosymbiont]